MALGDISAVIDTLEFDTATGQFPNIIHISGDIFAIAYGGPNSHGWLCTIDIGIDGSIENAVIDTLEFDATSCINPKVIHISGNVYAVVYDGGENIKIATVAISSVGDIGNTVLDTWQSTDSGANVGMGSVIHVSGDIYAIAYNATDYHGKVVTVDIDSAGTITAGEVDTFEFDASQGMAPSLIYISSTIYAVAYTGPGNDGWVATFTIETNGMIASIGDTTIATYEFDTTLGATPKILHISGDVYAIAYRGADSDGFVKTLEIDSAGAISVVIATLEFDTTRADRPDFIHISGTVYAVVYENTDYDGRMKTFTVSSGGVISAVLGTLEFETSYCRNTSLILHPDGTGLVAVAYTDSDTDGLIKTATIDSAVVVGYSQAHFIS